MKKSISMLVGFAWLLLVTHTSATEGEVPNMTIKISPSIPRAGEPVVYEAVLSGGTGNYQVGWWSLDPVLTNGIPPLSPKLLYGLTTTNTFTTGGLKEVFVLIQDAGTTNGLEKFISMRLVAFIVQESLDTAVTLQYPNGNEVWVPGSAYEIKWSATGSASNVMIILEHKDNTNSLPTIISSYTENDGSFIFTVPFGTNWVSKGSEGNLGGKNYRVRVIPVNIGSLLGSGGSTLFGGNQNESSDVSDDWFTITAGVNTNAVPLSLKDLRFSVASVQIDGAVVGVQYQIQSSVDLKNWRTNSLFTASAENSTNSFPISGGPSQIFRVVKEE